MAVTDALVTVDDYIATTGQSVSNKSVLERQLVASSRLFEREAGRSFTQDAIATPRVWKAKYSDILHVWGEGLVPGIATAVGLVIKVDTDNDGSFADETAWASSDYELLPRNALLDSDPRPYDCISVAPWGTKSFIPGLLVQVTAVYGWPSAPAAVKEDVIKLTAIWRDEDPRATGRMNELDQVVASSALASSLVARIRDVYRGQVAL